MNTGQTHNRNGNHPSVMVLHVFKAVRQKLNKIIKMAYEDKGALYP